MRGAGKSAHRALALGAALAAAALPVAATGVESFAIVAVADGPDGLDGDLAELAHQLRSACRDRVGNVLDVATMQARLLGQTDGATLAELDRAYGGALAVYQNGEFDSAVRTLRAIVGDLDALPEGREAYAQWTRAVVRLAHAAVTVGLDDEADGALARLLRVEPRFRVDPDQYSPTFRRRVEDVRARVARTPHRRMTILSAGRQGTVFVDGRASGTTPMTLFLPAARYRVGGAAGGLRVPSFPVDLTVEDRTVVLDFETAAAVRLNAGPGLAVDAGRRPGAIVRAGAWLDVDKLIVAARATEGGASFLVGAIHDVRRGALLREGSVRTVGGIVPAANIGALAAFLLTGAQAREVQDRTPDPIRQVAALGPSTPVTPAAPDLKSLPAATLEPAGPALPPVGTAIVGARAVRPTRADRAARWRRPAAWAAGGLSLALAGLAAQRAWAARAAYSDAEALLDGAGVLATADDLARYRDLTAAGEAATRGAWGSAAGALLAGAAAGYLGWTSAPGGLAPAF